MTPKSELQKNGFSCRKIGFPAEKCTFLQKNALSCGKMQFPAEKCSFLGVHMAENRRKVHEGFRAQESRTLANFHKKTIFRANFALQTCHPKKIRGFYHFRFRNGKANIFPQDFLSHFHSQEDVNGEKLTVKKYCGFLVPIFHGLRRVFHGL